MINSLTLEKLRKMKLNTFANDLEAQLQDSLSYSQLGFEERLGLLVDAEWNQKQANKLNRCINSAHFGVSSATIEEIEYLPDRKLDKGEIIRFSTCSFIDQNQHIIIRGATGSGKTYLACAIGKSACRKFKKVKYVRMTELLDELSFARINGSTRKVVDSYCKADLLIIDDWLIRKLNQQQAFDLFEIVQSRCDEKFGRSSMIMCSQYDFDGWYDRINPNLDSDDPVTEAIIDRIIHKSHNIFIQGDISMRERYGLNRSKKQADKS